MTGVGLEPTLSFPNQEITIKVTLTWRHNQLGHPALVQHQDFAPSEPIVVRLEVG
jgi:hypothetical protein